MQLEFCCISTNNFWMSVKIQQDSFWNSMRHLWNSYGSIEILRFPLEFRIISFEFNGNPQKSFVIPMKFLWNPMEIHRIRMEFHGNILESLLMFCKIPFEFSRDPLNSFGTHIKCIEFFWKTMDIHRAPFLILQESTEFVSN